jgi:diaminopimelate epimerase
VKLHFSKYSGAGNDFIVVDNRTGSVPIELAPRLCDRHEGIGADGVLLLESSTQADYRMRIINADGSEAAQCGNGLRCFMRYLHREIDGRGEALVETGGGLVRLRVEGDLIAAAMPSVQVRQWDLEAAGLPLSWLTVGVPHAVHFGQPSDMVTAGRSVRYHSHFGAEGTNVNFAWRNESGELELRTYERGVEGITQACGTGAVATACAASRHHQLRSPITLRTLRGDRLKVSFRPEGDHFDEIELVGPAHFVFNGTIDLN